MLPSGFATSHSLPSRLQAGSVRALGPGTVGAYVMLCLEDEKARRDLPGSPMLKSSTA